MISFLCFFCVTDAEMAAEEAPDDSFQIFVRSLSNLNVTVTVRPSTTVAQVLQMVAKLQKGPRLPAEPRCARPSRP